MAAASGDGEVEIHVVEVAESPSSSDESSPLLAVDDADNKPPRMTIFSVSYPRREPLKEPSSSVTDPEIAFLNQIVSWIWSGSRHSGLLCMASSSVIYYIMDVLLGIFPVGSAPIYQTVFTRCTILLIMSFMWLKRTGLPLLLPTHARNVLVLRSLTGFVSLLSFIYSVQNLPVSYAVLLNFATPIMASIGAMIILQEKLPRSHIGGLTCSFIGLLLILQPILLSEGSLTETFQMDNVVTDGRKDVILAIFVGIFSTILGGVSYCLIRAGAVAADQPVYTVFSFAILACPLSAICILIFQEFVLPNLFTFLLMMVLGVLAFYAEILLARGLQLGRIAKVTNIQYIKVLLWQLWSMTYLGAGPSSNKIIGCLLILASVCGTAYFGPDKENE
ncbi:hypothetical protein OPV22_034658 [Ensete ventricosum]|uniref:EamA domain-containing protein n=1 Tax=Ensete ventricosum TaxID=4639 RepID=A0AAV8PSY9_ENSVE|nr:hypothetical protein OPV22_034658 [Ensete ventricosum]